MPSRQWFTDRLNAFLDRVIFFAVVAFGVSLIGGIVVVAIALTNNASTASVVMLGLVAFAAVEWAVIGVRTFVWQAARRKKPAPPQPVRPQVPRRGDAETYRDFEIENVRWEDRGDAAHGEMIIAGPLCPEHLTPLIASGQFTGERVAEDGDIIRDDDGYRLTCLDDRQEFAFSRPRLVTDVRAEARTRFTGVRNRIRRVGRR